jgi:hypothetical protein
MGERAALEGAIFRRRELLRQKVDFATSDWFGEEIYRDWLCAKFEVDTSYYGRVCRERGRECRTKLESLF